MSSPLFTAQPPLAEYMFGTDDVPDHDALVGSLFPPHVKPPTRVRGMFTDPSFLHLPYEQQRTQVFALVREHGAGACLAAIRAVEADDNLRSRYSAVLTRVRRDIEDAHARTHPGEPLTASTAPSELAYVETMPAVVFAAPPAASSAPRDPWRASCFWLGYEFERATEALHTPGIDPAVRELRAEYVGSIPGALARLVRPRNEPADAARDFYEAGRAAFRGRS